MYENRQSIAIGPQAQRHREVDVEAGPEKQKIVQAEVIWAKVVRGKVVETGPGKQVDVRAEGIV
jgi:glutamine amidotransferase-like uncharacterized protein